MLFRSWLTRLWGHYLLDPDRLRLPAGDDQPGHSLQIPLTGVLVGSLSKSPRAQSKRCVFSSLVIARPWLSPLLGSRLPETSSLN
jgi:hypothetical protein